MEQFDILIVGGGASGLAAAVESARQDRRLRVGVIERLDRVGKKILATGNGRCNLSNLNVSPKDYNDPDFAKAVFSKTPNDENLRFFESMGLMTVSDSEGRVYPYSGTATSVLDVLRFEAERLGIEIICSHKAENVVKNGGFFVIDKKFTAPVLILSCGGKSSPSQGSDGSGYGLLRQLGIEITKLRPSLVQIKTQTDFVKSLKGLRVTAGLQLLSNNGKKAESRGEILFTDYGISGIAAMEVSRDAEKDDVLKIDFFPDMTEDELTRTVYLCAKRNRSREAGALLTGILHSRVGQALIKGVLSENVACSMLKAEQIESIVKELKGKKIKVTGKNGFDVSQVTAGGAELSQFKETLEAKNCRGLYVTGELLDIDGKCGGYNLSFAWSSGRTAGREAAQKILKRAKL